MSAKSKEEILVVLSLHQRAPEPESTSLAHMSGAKGSKYKNSSESLWKGFSDIIPCVQFSFCFFKIAILFRKLCHCIM